ncbi:MAG: hypothetical protein ABIT37_08500 [Luteolibacter sp.]
MSENPYQAPQTFEISETQTTDAEAIRQTHIRTEASIKSVGILYWLAAVAVVIAGIPIITAAIRHNDVTALQLAAGFGLLALGILQFIVGFEIRRLKGWARIAVGVLSGIGLLGFPVGTVINAYILFLLFGKKGRMIFSAPYKDIIAATPHVKYRTSKWVWIILIVVVLFIGGVITFSFLAR